MANNVHYEIKINGSDYHCFEDELIELSKRHPCIVIEGTGEDPYLGTIETFVIDEGKYKVIKREDVTYR